jgi:pre-mRNA-splicing factor CWC26
VKLEKAQFEWGLGTVQKQEAARALQHIADMADQPFARTEDDPQLEKLRKTAIRDGDPMAEYFLHQQAEAEELERDHIAATTGVKLKPRYSGPAPAPNRFGIAPGYRWDAVDRGNQFERQVMLFGSSRKASAEDKHRYSSSDL